MPKPKRPRPYRFFAMEGIDGAGKSLMLEWITSTFLNHGLPLMVFNDIGEAPVGDSVRSYLLSNARPDIGPARENLLVCAQRVTLTEECIRPSLQTSHVATDRSYLTGLVYQAMTRGYNLRKVERMQRLAADNLMPEMIFILDIPAEIAMERTRVRTETDWYETNRNAFNARRKAYLKLHKSGRHHTVLINANCPPEVVFTDIASHLRNDLNIPLRW